MRRRSLGITLCIALLLVALAAPAAAGGGREAAAEPPHSALVQRILGWLAEWVPLAPEGIEVVEAASETDDAAGVDSSDCVLCLGTQRAIILDPDG